MRGDERKAFEMRATEKRWHMYSPEDTSSFGVQVGNMFLCCAGTRVQTTRRASKTVQVPRVIGSPVGNGTSIQDTDNNSATARKTRPTTHATGLQPQLPSLTGPHVAAQSPQAPERAPPLRAL